MGNSVIYRPAYDAEVEYLEFPEDYRPYIMTPIHSQQDLIITCKFKLGRTDNGQRIFGCLSNFNDGQMVYNSLSYFGVINNVWHSYMYTNASSNISPDTEVHTLIFDVEHGDTYLDGILIKHLTIGTIETSVHYYTLGIVENNEAGSLSGYCKNLRLYSWSVSKNGITLIDLIPVRVGQIGYMYDKVTKQLFANKGTGQFILGNDVSNAVIPQQRCVFYSPMYDSQVEYLASTGTQWIDTKAENCKTFKFRFKALNAEADLKIFGNSDAYPKLAKFTLYQSLFRGTSIPVESNTWYDVEIQELNPPTLKITKGVEVYTGTLPYTGNRKPDTSYGTELPIFGIIESHSNGPFYTGSYFINRTNKYVQNETYFSYFQAFDENGVLIRDFIPVRKGQVGYMYDKVSKQLFTNKGTGSFILGSDTNDAVASQRSVGFERIYEEYD